MSGTPWAPHAQYKSVQPLPEIDPATFNMRGNHLAYAATQGIKITLASQAFSQASQWIGISTGRLLLMEDLIFSFFTPITIIVSPLVANNNKEDQKR